MSLDLDAIRRRHERYKSLRYEALSPAQIQATTATAADVPVLIAEVERLRDEPPRERWEVEADREGSRFEAGTNETFVGWLAYRRQNEILNNKILRSVIEHGGGVRTEHDRLAETLRRVRALAFIADDVDVTDWQRGYRSAMDNVRAALDALPVGALDGPAESTKDGER